MRQIKEYLTIEDTEDEEEKTNSFLFSSAFLCVLQVATATGG
jgi:hypothetical protein